MRERQIYENYGREERRRTLRRDDSDDDDDDDDSKECGGSERCFRCIVGDCAAPDVDVVVVVVVVVLATSTDSTNNSSERNSSVLSRPNVRSERTRGFIRIRGTVSESKNPKSVEERERSRRVCRASH